MKPFIAISSYHQPTVVEPPYQLNIILQGNRLSCWYAVLCCCMSYATWIMVCYVIWGVCYYVLLHVWWHCHHCLIPLHLLCFSSIFVYHMLGSATCSKPVDTTAPYGVLRTAICFVHAHRHHCFILYVVYCCMPYAGGHHRCILYGVYSHVFIIALYVMLKIYVHFQ